MRLLANVRAFTLIELLVVMTIIGLLSTMMMFSFEEGPKEKVKQSARELQAVLQRARTLALSTGRMHGVSFHIENAGDGTVLKNFSQRDGEKFPGRHWYCIIGPDSSDVDGRSSEIIPIARNGDTRIYFALDTFVKSFESAQVGPRHYLQPGVRFLALGDSDTLYSKRSGYDNATYPRPWFGYYDTTESILYPWGAYNRDIDLDLPSQNTGLDYEGEDGPIPYDADLDTNINPPEVWGRISKYAVAPHHTFVDSNLPDSSFYSWYLIAGNNNGPDVSYLASADGKKKPRPLVNAMWGDCVILFDKRGQAVWSYPIARDEYFKDYKGSERPTFEVTRSEDGYNCGRDNMGISHKEDKTGGYYITLARDVDEEDEDLYAQENTTTGQPAYNKFNSVEDAFQSITPFVRVFVNKVTGKSEVRDEAYPQIRIEANDLTGHDPFPRGY